jgi:hypothetical protein
VLKCCCGSPKGVPSRTWKTLPPQNGRVFLCPRVGRPFHRHAWRSLTSSVGTPPVGGWALTNPPGIGQSRLLRSSQTYFSHAYLHIGCGEQSCAQPIIGLGATSLKWGSHVAGIAAYIWFRDWPGSRLGAAKGFCTYSGDDYYLVAHDHRMLLPRPSVGRNHSFGDGQRHDAADLLSNHRASFGGPVATPGCSSRFAHRPNSRSATCHWGRIAELF